MTEDCCGNQLYGVAAGCESEGGISSMDEIRVARDECRKRLLGAISSFASGPREEMDQCINVSLKSAAESIGACRAQVLLLDGGMTCFSSTHEWCSEGTESLRERLQNVSAGVVSRWMETLRGFQGLVIPRLADIPPECHEERQHLEWQGMNSCAVIPVAIQGSLLGFLRFDSIGTDLAPDQECMGLLGTVGGVIAGAVERRRLAEALRQSEDIKSKITDAAVDSIFALDEDGRFIWVNQQAAKYLGRSATEIAGKNVRDLFQGDVAERHVAAVKEVYLSGEARNTFDSLEHMALGERWFNTQLSPVKDGDGKVMWVLGIASDITDRKTAEGALEESEHRFRTLFEKAPIGISLATMEGRMVAWNDEILRILRYSAEELARLYIESLYREPAEQGPVMDRLRAEGAVRGHNVALRRKDGSILHARLTISTVDYEGQKMLLTAVEDITEHKKAEDLLRIQRDIGIALSSTTDLGQAFNYMLESVCSMDGIDSGGVYRVDEATSDLDLMAHRGLSDGFINAVAHFDAESPNARIAVAGDPVYGRYSDIAPNMEGAHTEEHLEGIAVLPIKHEGRVISVLNIASHTRSDIPAPTRHALESIAAQVSGALGRLRAEEALKASVQKHRLLAENITDVIWTIDMDLKHILYASPSVERLTGYLPDEVVHMSLPQVLTPASLKEALRLFDAEIKKIHRGDFLPITVELDFKCRDGLTVSTESTISVVYGPNGVPMHILGVSRDITERKRLEEQLRQSAKMQAIGELAGGVAHEFNNMLTGILGYANMLRLTAEPGTTVHESARTIERAAERAADLTRKLLGFARRGHRRYEPVNLNDVIGEVVTLLSQTIDKNIKVSCDLSGEGITINGDAGQLEQVLLNLALNARDAMPGGGSLVFSTEVKDIDRTARLPEADLMPGKYAVITVADTGKGIPPENLGRIFEPFFTTKAKGSGTGMGLAMVYGTVKNHGGFIVVDSELGKGSFFRLHLPFERVQAPQDKRPESSGEEVQSARILVVDDEDLVREVASSMLEACGFSVVAFGSGREAVEYYEQHGQEVDLVLIDMVMPEMNGRDCFRALRQINPDVRAVLSTGYGADGEAREVVQEGMVGLVLKPFSRTALSSTVRDALSEYALPPTP